MIEALVLAFKQLGDRRIRRAILWTLLGALAISALLIAGATTAFALLEFSGITFIDWALALLGGIAAAFVAWMLFPVLAAEATGDAGPSDTLGFRFEVAPWPSPSG